MSLKILLNGAKGRMGQAITALAADSALGVLTRGLVSPASATPI